MKTIFKFIVTALVFAISLAAYVNLEAQSRDLTERTLLPTDFYVMIRVQKAMVIGTYDLEAIVRIRGETNTKPAYEVQWFKYNKPFSGRWKLEGVGYGPYTVIVTNTADGNWARAKIYLKRPAVVPYEISDM